MTSHLSKLQPPPAPGGPGDIMDHASIELMSQSGQRTLNTGKIRARQGDGAEEKRRRGLGGQLLTRLLLATRTGHQQPLDRTSPRGTSSRTKSTHPHSCSNQGLEITLLQIFGRRQNRVDCPLSKSRIPPIMCGHRSTQNPWTATPIGSPSREPFLQGPRSLYTLTNPATLLSPVSVEGSFSEFARQRTYLASPTLCDKDLCACHQPRP